MSKRTPLYNKHIILGGKMVDFAGYELPLQYSGVIAEHNAVRTSVGLFDVSHMGEFVIEGEKAESALNYLLSNDISGMKNNCVKYSLLPNENGGAVDDVLVYRSNDNLFWIVVNGANVEKDANWIKAHLQAGVNFYDRSEDTAQIAIQGPKSEAVLKKLIDEKFIPKKNYTFIPDVDFKGIDCCVSRTGYTAEDGFELYCNAALAEQLYDLLSDAGKEYGIMPCGLGARDTLRLEGAMPLYGHELNEDIPIIETGLNFAIKNGKSDFIGKTAIESHVPVYARIGAKAAERGIAREGCRIFCGSEDVGCVTSGTHSPTFGEAICMLRIKRAFADKELFADVRGKKIKLEVVPLPFYKRIQ